MERPADQCLHGSPNVTVQPQAVDDDVFDDQQRAIDGDSLEASHAERLLDHATDNGGQQHTSEDFEQNDAIPKVKETANSEKNNAHDSWAAQVDDDKGAWKTVSNIKRPSNKPQGAYQDTLSKRATKKPLQLNL